MTRDEMLANARAIGEFFDKRVATRSGEEFQMAMSSCVLGLLAHAERQTELLEEIARNTRDAAERGHGG